MGFQYLVPLPFYVMLAPEHVFELAVSRKVVRMQFRNPTEIRIPPAPRTTLVIHSDEELIVDELEKIRLHFNTLLRAYRIVSGETYNNGVIRPIPHAGFFKIVIKIELDNEGKPIGPPSTMQYVQRLMLGTISGEQYKELKQIIHSSRTLQRHLTEELLLGAKTFFHEEDYRMAVLEAVIALDIMIASIIRKIGRLRGISKGSLKDFLREVGLNRSMKVVLKMIIPDRLPDDDVLEGCKTANTLRNKIVHEGRLNVSEIEAREAIQNIKTFIEHITPTL